MIGRLKGIGLGVTMQYSVLGRSIYESMHAFLEKPI